MSKPTVGTVSTGAPSDKTDIRVVFPEFSSPTNTTYCIEHEFEQEKA